MGRKLVWHRFFDDFGRLDCYSIEPLDYLQRMLLRFDGKSERDSDMTILTAVRLAEENLESEAETEYVRIKWFKNRAAHLVFKRPDLVDKFNKQILQRFPDALPVPNRNAFAVGKVGWRAAG
jgi:hypothetical protein